MIADWKHTFAIEVKSRSDTEKKLSSNVRRYSDIGRMKQRVVFFYMGDVSCNINGVNYISWKDWGELEKNTEIIVEM